MNKKTVKRRIFLSNAWMVLVTLVLFLAINLAVVKVYGEAVEHELKASLQQVSDEDDLEELIESFTIHKEEFILLFLADGLLCVAALLLVSQLFTRHLTEQIMQPLDALSEGAERIRGNDLTQPIEYHGDLEFKTVCNTFNDMQQHILTEQEKNRKYEQARREMIAGISHDLRTPLTAIRGTVKGLLDGIASTPEQQQRFLQVAWQRTGDMDVLLNQLFYLSRLETGNMPLQLQNLDITAFLRSYTEGKYQYEAGQPEEITTEIRDADARIQADPEQLQRMLDNLLENSRKYADVSQLKIRITLEAAGENVRIRFADNGNGVPEDKLPHLFEEFYRCDESRNRKEGNGLGLYIVKYLAEAMGGSVRAENIREGSGTGFAVSMEFPRKETTDEYAGE